MSEHIDMKNRYFYVQYSFKDGVGAIPIESKGMLNNEGFKNFIKKQNPNLRNVFILGWIEMTKEDSEAFNGGIEYE